MQPSVRGLWLHIPKPRKQGVIVAPYPKAKGPRKLWIVSPYPQLKGPSTLWTFLIPKTEQEGITSGYITPASAGSATQGSIKKWLHREK